MAKLSTHVLDTSRGVPAEGVVIDLHLLCDAERRHVKTVRTDAGGRTGQPLLQGATMDCGVYELTFHAADYFRATGCALPDPPFLDQVTVRFGIWDSAGDYHVPLLLSPYGYSTYRGS